MPEYGDCNGVESGRELKSDVHLLRLERYGRRLVVAAKEYPPPIPGLVHTANKLSHMPWVMKKYYSGDGRLIIKEEKEKPRQYFVADRSNGRLVLYLVNLDDDCKECHANDEIGVVGSNSAEEINGEIDDPAKEKVSPECWVNPCGATAAAPPVHTCRAAIGMTAHSGFSKHM